MALFLIIYQIMRTTVTQLLREVPKVRRAAMRGDRVIISTRQGNLVLTKETSSVAGLMGRCDIWLRISVWMHLNTYFLPASYRLRSVQLLAVLHVARKWP
jgi:hypothetical protein